ncbi:hypothetical protein [Pseudomonas sp.]|uniref:hypothetical protein n=1 Tax=Pseudomonas sp. TaxID=306 RepID=UPI004053C893
MDVAQEAHFSNRDTRDGCQDGKQIKDVSKQSAKAPQCGVFFFMLNASMRVTHLGLRAKTLPTFLWPTVHGSHPSGHRCAMLKIAPGNFFMAFAKPYNSS